jgi:solute carrier family 10 (sodium/bile acid cotransporter), member 7
MRVFPKGSGLSVALFAVFIAAWLAPALGLKGGPLFPERLSSVAVFVIFLVQGWKLNSGRLKEAFADLRTLFFLHSFIFLVPGIMAWGICELELVDPVWRPGLFFLAILPTTISSCVVYTRLAGGDADAALGHATLSNLLGMLWVPLVVFFCAFQVFGSREAEDDLLVSLGLLPDFLLMVFLPVFIGWWGKNKLSWDFLPEDASWVDKIPVGCILLLAYFSFCSLFAEFGNELFGRSSGILAAVVLVLLLVVTVSVWALGRFVCGSRAARITFLFCGGQKSLALGLPLAQMLFVSEETSVGLLVLPLAIFHFGQLLLGAFLIGPLNRWTKLR